MTRRQAPIQADYGRPVREPGQGMSRIEQANQKAAVQWLRLVLPSQGATRAKVFHVPNGGYRRKVEAAILVGMGVLAGIPDVVCLLPEGQTLLFEFKKDAATEPEQHQKDIHDDLRHLGFRVAVVVDIADCRRALREWGVPIREVYRDE